MSSVRTQVDRHAYLATAPLQPGDRVRLISPAGPGKPEAIERAVEHYRAWDLDVVLGRYALAKDERAAYLAGSDDQRRADLVEAWLDPDVDAVVCVRGGYGAMRLLGGLDWEQLRAGSVRRDGRPKLLTGSSDVTALHEAFRLHLDVPTLFCPMPGTAVFHDSPAVRDDVHRWLFEAWGGRELVGPRTEVLAPGGARGRFTGGNLSLLVMAVGSAESVPVEGGILFLEDINEDVYRLDGFLLQMDRAGLLDAAAGIVLGSWHGCEKIEDVRALMTEYFAGRGRPVLWEQGFGHDPEALSVPLNVDGVLDAVPGITPRLRVAEGPR